ncbi:MAG: DNA internalization-related competence protein ComEC/Rec2 [Burkholderiaceae bacterium]
MTSILFALRLPIALYVCAGIWLVHQRPSLAAPQWGPACMVAAVAALIVAHRCRAARPAGRQALAVTACIVIGIGWAQWLAHDRLQARIASSSQGQSRTFDARIERMPIVAEDGVRLVARVVRCIESGGDCREGQQLRLSWRSPTAVFEPGQVWRFRARWRLPHGLSNPHGFDAELRALQDDIAVTGNVSAAWRPSGPDGQNGQDRQDGQDGEAEEIFSLRHLFERWRTRLAGRIVAATPSLSADARGVLLGLVIGDQASISAEWWALFNRTGIGHLFSISGGHVTMFAAVSASLVALLWRNRRLARAMARWTGRPPAGWLATPHACWSAGVSGAFAYAGLAGWALPAQRTCWMLLAAGLASLSGRARGPSTVLGIALLIIVAADPWAPLSPSLWLSFVAVGVILMVSQRRAVAEPVAPGWRRRAIGVLAGAGRAQWAVTLIMVPVGALFFAGTSWISPFANALAIPLVSLLVTPAAIVGALLAGIDPALGAPVLGLTGAGVQSMVDALNDVDRWADGARHFNWTLGVPDTATLLLALAGCVALLVPWPIRHRHWFAMALLPALVSVTPSAAGDGWTVTAIDVGQGMAVLVEGPGFRLLYDTGPRQGAGADAGSRVIVPWLRARGITRLDALVLSHDDDDHVGGASSILAAMTVDRVYGALPAMHPLVRESPRFEPCRRGEGWRWQQTRFEWLHPGPDPDRDGRRVKDNARSCVLRIDGPAGSLLLPGDIEAPQEKALLADPGAPGLKADVLIAPHHGSLTSSTPAFVAAVDPALVVFQAGYRNPFRHPRPEVVARYAARCAWIARTDAAGAITIRLAPEQPIVLTRWRERARRYWHLDRSDLDEADASEADTNLHAGRSVSPAC